MHRSVCRHLTLLSGFLQKVLFWSIHPGLWQIPLLYMNLGFSFLYILLRLLLYQSREKFQNKIISTQFKISVCNSVVLFIYGYIIDLMYGPDIGKNKNIALRSALHAIS